MNKSEFIRIVLCHIVLSFGVWHDEVRSQPIESKSEQSSIIDIGRDNPFAKILKKGESTIKQVSQNLPSDGNSPDGVDC